MTTSFSAQNSASLSPLPFFVPIPCLLITLFHPRLSSPNLRFTSAMNLIISMLCLGVLLFATVHSNRPSLSSAWLVGAYSSSTESFAYRKLKLVLIILSLIGFHLSSAVGFQSLRSTVKRVVLASFYRATPLIFVILPLSQSTRCTSLCWSSTPQAQPILLHAVRVCPVYTS